MHHFGDLGLWGFRIHFPSEQRRQRQRGNGRQRSALQHEARFGVEKTDVFVFSRCFSGKKICNSSSRIHCATVGMFEFVLKLHSLKPELLYRFCSVELDSFVWKGVWNHSMPQHHFFLEHVTMLLPVSHNLKMQTSCDATWCLAPAN